MTMAKSWKSTLRLPTSTFAARPNLSQLPQHIQQCADGLYAWQAANRPNDDQFILHDGPPYANGPLHIGHAINKTLKDIIVRHQVQQGKRVVYRAGWDCHGLPIEMKALGSSHRKDLSPVKIREKAQDLASKTITEQMKGFRGFGVMSEWDNKWTTMDKEYEIRQLRVFQKLVRHGMIYRKYKPVYWSTSSRTALAEAELEYQEHHPSKSAYIRYPIASEWTATPGLKGPLYAAIWTTTPWTLPANKAIAVHEDMKYWILQADGYGLIVAADRVKAVRAMIPKTEVILEDFPGSQLVGLQYKNKLQGDRLQSIIHADFVTADSGTGLVHIAPGHGQEDYEVCSKLGIEAFAPITDDGHFTADAFPEDPERLTSAPTILDGGSEAVLELMGDDVLGSQLIRHKYPYDWRTKQPVVIRATAQWFADVGSIKDDALQALKDVHFVPEHGRGRLESFVKGRSEWCISRQRSWGLPIPALYGESGKAVMTEETIEHIISVIQKRSLQAWFSDAPDDLAWIPESLQKQGKWERGTDTMDVWFDSGSSWMESEGQADVYLEGSDQHRGWFQSSLLTYVAAQKADGVPTSEIKAPFKTLITHGFTLDDKGRKMSKSLGNTIAPKEIMDGTLLPPVKPKKGPPRADGLGPDALRMWAAMSDFTSDILVGQAVLQSVQSALLKYRTTLKMLVGSLHEDARRAPLSKVDQIALMQMLDAMEQVNIAFTNHEYYKGVQHINRWVSTDLSAFYLETLKDRLYCGDGGGIIEPIFIGFLRMLAPITPILVEEVWSHRPQWMKDDTTIEHPARQLYEAPLISADRLTAEEPRLREDWEALECIRSAVRYALEYARSNKDVGSSLQCSCIIQIKHNYMSVADILHRYQDELEDIMGVSTVGLNWAVPTDVAWSHNQAFALNDWNGEVFIIPPVAEKCPRCWKYQSEAEDTLCTRCKNVVDALPEAAV